MEISPRIPNITKKDGKKAIMTPGTIMGPNLTTDPSMDFAQFSKLRIHQLQYLVPAPIKIDPATTPANKLHL